MFVPFFVVFLFIYKKFCYARSITTLPLVHSFLLLENWKCLCVCIYNVYYVDYDDVFGDLDDDDGVVLVVLDKYYFRYILYACGKPTKAHNYIKGIMLKQIHRMNTIPHKSPLPIVFPVQRLIPFYLRNDRIVESVVLLQYI